MAQRMDGDAGRDAGVLAGSVRGVMFDFSGTLFRIEPTEDWLRAVVADAGIDLPEAELISCAALLEEAGALPGGASPRLLPARLEPLWRERDLSPEQHRAACTALAREVPLPSAELADALYERHRSPAAWRPSWSATTPSRIRGPRRWAAPSGWSSTCPSSSGRAG